VVIQTLFPPQESRNKAAALLAKRSLGYLCRTLQLFELSNITMISWLEYDRGGVMNSPQLLVPSHPAVSRLSRSRLPRSSLEGFEKTPGS